mgnify:CR=1 FL=1
MGVKTKKPKVELIEVKSLSKKIGENWNELFKVKIKVNGVELDFEDALEGGVIEACKRIFSDKIYNYKSFDYKYSRNPVAPKRMFED